MCVCHDPGPLFHLRRPLTALADSSLAMVPRPQFRGSPSTPASSSMNFQHLENSSDEPQLNKQQSSHGSDTRPDTSITITCCECGSTVWLEEADVPNRRSCDGKSWKPTLPAGAFLVKPNCRVPERLKCGKSISSALSTNWSITVPCVPGCFHIVGLVHCLRLTISITSMFTTIHFITAAARVVHSLPCARMPRISR